MDFAALASRSRLSREQLCGELKIDDTTLDSWLSGWASPPGYVVRALISISTFASAEERPLTATDRGKSGFAEANSFGMISLFAGAGGLDIGLERTGFQTLLANEIEAHACASLRANKLLATLDPKEFDVWFSKFVVTQRCFKTATKQDLQILRERLIPALTSNTRPLAHAKIVEGDVRKLDSDFILQTTGIKIGEIALIAGGAPCQPFSRAGKQETVDCDDGRLFLEFVRLVNQIRPRWFLFENVKGLVQHRTDTLCSTCQTCRATRPVSFELRFALQSSDAVIDTCANCGTADVVSPRWEKRRGGSLEMIEGEFSRIGYKCYSKVLNARDYGVAQDRERLFIVGSRDGEEFDWPVPTHGQAQTTPSLFTDSSRSSYESVRSTLYEHGHWRYGELDERAVLWVKNVVRPHDEPVTWSLDRFSPTVGAHQAAKLAIAPHGVPEAQLARQQWHTLGRRQGDTPPVFVEHEYLTDLELMTLQTFPHHWYLHGTRMQRAFQIGNAVPPNLAAAVGAAIMRAGAMQNMSHPALAVAM